MGGGLSASRARENQIRPLPDSELTLFGREPSRRAAMNGELLTHVPFGFESEDELARRSGGHGNLSPDAAARAAPPHYRY